MFSKLKEKLKSWTKSLSKKAEESAEEKKETAEILIEEKQKEKHLEKIEIPMKFEPGLEKLKGKIKEKRPKKFKEPEEKIKELEETEPGKPGFFKRIASKITKIKISEQDFEVYAEELEMTLLENNVALEVAEKMIQELKLRIVGKEFLKKEVEEQIKESFKDIIYDILIEPFDVSEKIKEKKKNPETKNEPYVILFCGINGTGKTTTIAKIANYLKSKNISVVLVAADTFRAASIEQIKKHGEKIGVKVIAQNYGADPASVGFDAIQYAKRNKIESVLIDTAGRMHTAKNLLKEIEKIARVTKPDLKIFIGESITGNDAVEQVRAFDSEINIDGIVLTKADIDEKGGTALSVGYVTKKPILYLGTGQEYEAIEPFDKQKFIERLGL
ncbi:MAG TPA: signal recognition particle-docking protein FtsY [Candidatus Nanoarchaeia archaeon]|nr:signal recognition particle-docking protein FtsY [Candidatus Nanoarchaeia archaeon]